MILRMTSINLAAIAGMVTASFFIRTNLPLWTVGLIALGTLAIVNLAGYRGAKRDQTGISDFNRSKAGLWFMWIVIAAAILLALVFKQ